MKCTRYAFVSKVLVFVLLVVVLFGAGCSKKDDGEPNLNSRSSDMAEQAKDAKQVKLETSYGEIIIELNEEASPITVKNFLGYVEEGFYDGTIFHRVINGFMIQGGGLTADMAEKPTHAPIVNEAKNMLKNDRGTIAMARQNAPDSATSQFFINHKNNDSLNYPGPYKPGYAVFGKVVKGMEVLDAIAVVKTTRRGGMGDVPVEPVVIKSVKIIVK